MNNKSNVAIVDMLYQIAYFHLSLQSSIIVKATSEIIAATNSNQSVASE
tara:strand:+ start:529 stop:675 length:147 start_codon:yes stop_codon:yes gene_type:complete